MSDYFIPLTTLLPSVAGFPLDKLPLLGGLYKSLGSKVGVRNIRQAWNDTHFVIEGEGVVEGEAVIDVLGLGIVLGKAGGGLSGFRFEVAAARRSLLEALGGDSTGADASAKVFLDADAFPTSFSISIHDLGLRLRLPEQHVQLGSYVKSGDTIIAIQAVAADEPVEIKLPQATLTLDTEKGVSLSFDESQVLDCPPFLLRESMLGFEIRKMKLDFSKEKGFAEVLSRPGFDETWQGVFIEDLAIYGLNNMLPFLPSRVAATKWLLGGEGLTGSVDVAFPSEKEEGLWRLATLGIEFDRGALVRGTIGVFLRAGGISNDFAGIGPKGDLELSITLRHNPGVPGVDAWGFDIALRTPDVDDNGLLTLKKDTNLVLLGLFAPSLLAVLEEFHDSNNPRPLVMYFLALISKLQLANELTFERITLDGLKFRYYSKNLNGHVARHIEFIFDVQARVSLNLPLAGMTFILPDIKTDRPIGVTLKGLTVRWIPNFNAIPSETVGDLKLQEVAFEWDLDSGVSFDVGEQSLVQGSPLLIVKVGAGRWEKGIWIEVGIKVAGNLGECAVAAYPSVFRLWYLNDGKLDHVSFEGLSFTILVPEVIYCRGDLGWGQVKKGTVRAFLLGNGTARLNTDLQNGPPNPLAQYMKRSSWFLDLGGFVRVEELQDATSITVGVDFNVSNGIPLGTTGVSIFGLLGQYAQNSRPAVEDGDYRGWFMEKPPRNRVNDAGKWVGEPGKWGFGFGTVIGSSDMGRTWNAKLGLVLLTPGPVVMLYGSANLLSAKPNIGDEQSAAVVAIVVLDLEDDTITLGITINYKVPDDGKLLDLTVPTEIFADLHDASRTHFYLGEYMPISRRVVARTLGKFDISGYLMVDGQPIPDIDVPAMVIALGGRAAYEKKLGSGRLKCKFYLGVEFHLAVGLPHPWLFKGTLQIDGGLVVKVFGFGFEFGVWAKLMAVAPSPYSVKGEVGVSIDLPWPLRDIKTSISLTLVDEGGKLPAPSDAVSGLTLHLRNENRPVEIARDGTTTGVPIDPTFTLSFNFPIRNESPQLGSFNLSAVNKTTRILTSGGQGYSFQLEQLLLTNNTSGTIVNGPFPALWRMETAKAPGGSEQRQVLELFSYDQLISSRYIGTSAEYVEQLTENWEPCPMTVKLKPACYFFEEEPVGPVGELLVESKGHPKLKVSTKPPPPDAEVSVHNFALTTSLAKVVETPLPLPGLPVKGIQIPGVYGSPSQLFGWLNVSETLVLTFPRALLVVLDVVRFNLSKRFRGPIVVVSFYNGDELIKQTIEGDTTNVAGPAENTLYTCLGPLTRVELFAAHWIHAASPFDSPLHPDPPPALNAYLYSFCAIYESEINAYEQAQATSGAWENFWADLMAQQAGSSDALLLEPGSNYTLEARVRWQHVENGSESGGDVQTFQFNFETVPLAEPPATLRKRDPALAPEEDGWEVNSLPTDDTYAMYTERPIRLDFSDPRIEAVYKKFQRRLVLRLVDDHGEDLFQTLKFIQQHAKELPEYKKVWQQKVADGKCTPDGIRALWDQGSASFTTILQANRWYDAFLVPVPDSTADEDLPNVAWGSLSPVYSFKFKTSRWKSLTQHLSAYTLKEEFTDKPPQLDTIKDEMNALLSGLTFDDQTLDRVLYERLHLPFREPAGVPELIVIWQPTDIAQTQFAIVGLLLDGPEPLIRGADTKLEAVAESGNSVPFLHLAGKTGARSLLLFSKAGSFSPPEAKTLTLSVTEPFTDKNGNATTETASLTLSLPTQPNVFAKETAP